MRLRQLLSMAAALVAASAVALMVQRPLGLTVRAGPVGRALPAISSRVDLAPSGQAVESLRGTIGVKDIQVQWDGLIGWPSDDSIALRLRARGSATVAIDGETLLSLAGPDVGQATTVVSRSTGPHAIAVAYDPGDADAWVHLEWDVPRANEFRDVPPEALAPGAVARHVWPWRGAASTLFAIAGGACGLVVLVALARIGIRWLPPGDVTHGRDVRLVLAGIAVLVFAGIWWGWPGGEWAADELTPSVVLDALSQHLAHGWADKYPPLHYYLLAIAYAPLVLAQHLRPTLTESALETWLFLTGRVLSALMAIATIAMVARLAGRELGPRYAWPAAVASATALPLAFYAKTTNVDVPCLFWVALSFTFLAELYRAPRIRDAICFAIAAACAIGTKDPSYGLYVLPVMHLAWRLGRSASGRRVLAVAALVGTVALLLAFNVVFNPSGFVEHVRIVRGPASTGYRMFPATPVGEWRLLVTTLELLMWTLGVPGVVIVAVGLFALWRRSMGVRLPIWIWLAAASYYVGFLAIAGYVYDRFLLPETMLLAFVGAVGLRWLIDEAPFGHARRVVAGAFVVWLAWRAGSVDWLMIRDSRNDAEAWLRAHVTLGQMVVAIPESGYGARLDEFSGININPSKGATLAANPDFLVLNTEYTRRFTPGSSERAWQEWLDAGDGPYACVYRHRTPLALTAFAWSPRMTDEKEDPFTNLDKIGPEIAIYARKK